MNNLDSVSSDLGRGTTHSSDSLAPANLPPRPQRRNVHGHAGPRRGGVADVAALGVEVATKGNGRCRLLSHEPDSPAPRNAATTDFQPVSTEHLTLEH